MLFRSQTRGILDEFVKQNEVLEEQNKMLEKQNIILSNHVDNLLGKLDCIIDSQTKLIQRIEILEKSIDKK